jgi:hypothetical protein
MFRVPRIRRWFLLAALLVVVAPVALTAQEAPDDVPLGDVARNLRKNSPLKRQVIDDDNLSDVMRKNEHDDTAGSSLRFLMPGEGKGFQLTSPDVTCSLAFTANVKALLSANQYAQMDLPPIEIAKLEAQAVIEGDALTVPVFNGTEWHLSELAVALTVIKSGEVRSSWFEPSTVTSSALRDSAHSDAISPKPSPTVASNGVQEVRPEKKPDVTRIYHMRAAAPPWARAVFSAPLNLDLAPGEEWHWAIVQAKGYPPQIPDQMSQAVPPEGERKIQPEPSPVLPIPQASPPAGTGQNTHP